LAACGSDRTGTAPVSATTVYWALSMNYHAVTMSSLAPQNTVQLTAIPVNASEAPLSGFGRVTYTVADSAVTVDSTGLVTALYRTGGTRLTRVVATLRDPEQNVTHTDTAYVRVTDTLPHSALATFSIQPVPGDSAKISRDYEANNGSVTLPVYATDSAGNTICDASNCPLPVYFTSSNATVAAIGNTTGQITTGLTGYATFRATALVYGRVVSDSLVYEVGNTIFGIDNLVTTQGLANLNSSPPLPPPNHFEPQTLTIGVGGEVWFWPVMADTLDTVDVTFDNPNAITGSMLDNNFNFLSNIVNSAFLLTTYSDPTQQPPYNFPGTLGDVFFPTKGTFTYHSRKLGTGGTIIVGD
jgi:hypothetical protein